MGNYDVIVVGGGSAGLIAAMAAADEGVKVLQIEKTSGLGGCWEPTFGNHCTSAGAQTIMQFEAGIFDDSPSLFYSECMLDSEARARTTPEILRFYCQHAGAVVDWLDKIGAYNKRGRKPLESRYGAGWSLPRSYRLNTDFGQLILDRHQQRVARGDVELLFNMRVDRLVTEMGDVVGVITEDESGSAREYRSPSVIMCTGGFGSNIELVATYNLPQASSIVTMAAPSATGDGFIMCRDVGAQMVNLSDNTAWGMLPTSIPDPDNPGRRLTSVNMDQYPGVIWVNRYGQRVINEDCGVQLTNLKSRDAMNNIPDAIIVLLDQRIIEENPPIVVGRDWQWFQDKANEGIIIQKADSIEELGRLINIDSGILVDTIANYNQGVQSGADAEFKRGDLKYKIEKPPFYAITTATMVVFSRGGPVTNMYQQVLAEGNQVIPGLYAAGEVTGYQGHGTGRLNMGCFIFGQQAGKMAARHCRYRGIQ